MLARAAALTRVRRAPFRILMARQDARDLAELANLVERAVVVPVIDHRLALAEAPAAVRYLHEEHTRGKVVLVREAV